MRERLRAVLRGRDVIGTGPLPLTAVLRDARAQAALELALVERELRVGLQDDELRGEVFGAAVGGDVV